MKFILFLLLIYSLLPAKNINAQYKISYGIFSNLGLADASFEINKDTYYIKIHAYTTGFAKFISNSKEETFQSYGKLINHKLIPEKFIKTIKSNNLYKIKTYTFDYKKQIIKEHIFIDKIVQEYDEEFKLHDKRIIKTQNKNLNYFVKNDILSIFFNLKSLISNFDTSKEHKLLALGGNKKRKGEIIIEIPKGKNKVLLNESLNINSKIKFIAYINQKIFSSKEGKLYISLNKDFICNKAVLSDVLFFGDIVGKLKSYKVIQ